MRIRPSRKPKGTARLAYAYLAWLLSAGLALVLAWWAFSIADGLPSCVASGTFLCGLATALITGLIATVAWLVVWGWWLRLGRWWIVWAVAISWLVIELAILVNSLGWLWLFTVVAPLACVASSSRVASDRAWRWVRPAIWTAYGLQLIAWLIWFFN
ncbi:MAG: hypothetical protein LBV30_03705 [Propionibacteriaceae bacterium]|jgi:hypothetical protein|nr:hypothetical protein [Propionibacteriaceae bacterium]